jgi:hypothetical protein
MWPRRSWLRNFPSRNGRVIWMEPSSNWRNIIEKQVPVLAKNELKILLKRRKLICPAYNLSLNWSRNLRNVSEIFWDENIFIFGKRMRWAQTMNWAWRCMRFCPNSKLHRTACAAKIQARDGRKYTIDRWHTNFRGSRYLVPFHWRRSFDPLLLMLFSICKYEEKMLPWPWELYLELLAGLSCGLCRFLGKKWDRDWSDSVDLHAATGRVGFLSTHSAQNNPVDTQWRSQIVWAVRGMWLCLGMEFTDCKLFHKNGHWIYLFNIGCITIH